MRCHRFAKVLCIALLSSVGCGERPPLTLDLTRLGAVFPNDSYTNGLTLNGLTLNGLTLNGITLNGSGTTQSVQVPRPVDLGRVAFAGMMSDAGPLSAGALNGSVLEGMRGTQRFSGADMRGVRLEGTLLNGMAIPLRIDDVAVDSTGTTMYSIAILSDTGPVPLCGESNGVPIPSIALAGYWDLSSTHVNDNASFTFGCINAAIGKCVLWGYKPWATAEECRHHQCKTRNLSDWHRACVRAVRADYCGDGISHTRSGTLINVYDPLSIQATSNPGWDIEAEWRGDGAACINHTRWVTANTAIPLTDLAYVKQVCPDRLAEQGHRCDPDKSIYNTQFGFNRPPQDRPLIRNESPQYQ